MWLGWVLGGGYIKRRSKIEECNVVQISIHNTVISKRK
jgi:hypothetical protein